MPSKTIMQSSFNSGELSPKVMGRVDLDRYQNGCKTVTNFIPMIQGPITRRPGFEYLGAVKTASKETRLVPFEYSDEQSYMLEFGDLYIRFWKNGGIIYGGNLVVNGDMETTGHWADFGTVSATDQSYAQVHGGLYSFTFNAGDINAAAGIQSDDFTTVTGEIYAYDLWVYAPAGATSIWIKIKNGDDSTYIVNSSKTVTGGAWTNVSGTYTENHGGPHAYLKVLSGSSTGVHYVDDVEITPTVSTAYEVVTTYTESEVFDLDFCQIADTLFIAHGSHAPAKLVRFADDRWTLSTLSFHDGPYATENVSSITLDPSAKTGSITIVASADMFAATDVGRYVALRHLDLTLFTTLSDWFWGWGYATITAFTNPTTITATVIRDFAENTATAKWKLGAWSATTGYPKKVALDKDRLIWASSSSYPENLWASKVGLYTDHGSGVNHNGYEIDPVDSDALNLGLATTKVSTIQWIRSLSKLIVGTQSYEGWISSATGTGAVTPNSKQTSVGSWNGCGDSPPVLADNAILYLSRNKKVLRELIYSFGDESFSGNELTILSDHLTEIYNIVQMAYQGSPYKVVWMVRADGKLIGLTYDKGQKVVGWHYHETDGDFKACAVIPGGTDKEDELWVIVDRTVSGSTVRYIERLHSVLLNSDSIETPKDITNSFYLDSGLSYDERQAVGSITYADPGIINLTAHGYSDGNRVKFRTVDDTVSGEEDFDSLHYEEFVVAHKADDTFQLHDDDGNDVDLTGYKQVLSATVGKMATTISGLDHLEGRTVSILADGQVIADQVVSSGDITLTGNGASVVHAGLNFISDLVTLNPESSASATTSTYATNTIQVDTKKILSVMLRLLDSASFFLGEDATDLVEYSLLSDATPSGRSVDLFTGDTDLISFGGKQRTNVGMMIRQSLPLPLTILAIIYEIDLE